MRNTVKFLGLKEILKWLIVLKTRPFFCLFYLFETNWAHLRVQLVHLNQCSSRWSQLLMGTVSAHVPGQLFEPGWRSPRMAG